MESFIDGRDNFVLDALFSFQRVFSASAKSLEHQMMNEPVRVLETTRVTVENLLAAIEWRAGRLRKIEQ